MRCQCVITLNRSFCSDTVELLVQHAQTPYLSFLPRDIPAEWSRAKRAEKNNPKIQKEKKKNAKQNKTKQTTQQGGQNTSTHTGSSCAANFRMPHYNSQNSQPCLHHTALRTTKHRNNSQTKRPAINKVPAVRPALPHNHYPQRNA